MIKLKKIDFLPNFKIQCLFNDGRQGILDFNILNDQYAQKIKDNNCFELAKIGDLGQIYWDDIGQITLSNGKIESCQYDISPEFAYQNLI